jgi:Secretion system C-terminal sorting domain
MYYLTKGGSIMKTLLISVVTILVGSFSIFGQSVMNVPADSAGNPVINSLIKYVVADTDAQGHQKHDIYKLQRGKYYFFNQTAVFKNPITLEADPPGTVDTTFPPKFIIVPDDQGQVDEADIINAYANVTCKNIAFSSITTDNQYSWANAIILEKDSLRVEFDDCYFELLGWAFIEADGVNHTRLIVRNCETRNGSPFGGDEWVPFFLEASGGSVDTCIMTNNTFFGIQGSVLNIEPLTPWKYIFFDHNTCVNIVQNFTTDVAAHLNSTITNNIFYNVGDYGSRISDIQSGGGDHVQGGVIEVDTLPSNTPEGSNLPHIMDEKDRVLKVKNNVYFWSQQVKDYYTAEADSIESIPWLSSRGMTMFGDKTTWPNFVEQNNVEADPGFANFGGTTAMVQEMYNDRNTGTFGFWGWDPDSVQYPTEHWALEQWPLPENFSYSASFTSTDGYHVGSLQWYPDELKNYEQNATAIRSNKKDQLPSAFKLAQNYPNPFNPTTNINYSVPRNSFVTIKVYDVLGNQIETLVNEEKAAGNYFVRFDGANLASGVYFCRMEAGNFVSTKKLVLMK